MWELTRPIRGDPGYYAMWVGLVFLGLFLLMAFIDGRTFQYILGNVYDVSLGPLLNALLYPFQMFYEGILMGPIQTRTWSTFLTKFAFILIVVTSVIAGCVFGLIAFLRDPEYDRYEWAGQESLRMHKAGVRGPALYTFPIRRQNRRSRKSRLPL